MTSLADELAAISTDLTKMEVEFALVGGLAVSVRSEPRFTRDIDLVLAVADDETAESVAQRLAERGWASLAVLEQTEVNRLAMVRVARSSSGVVVDLLTASSGIEAEIVAGADVLEVLPGVVVPVATIGHLMATKLLSSDATRPQDVVDLQALLSAATSDDLDRCREAVNEIEERGFARGRRLSEAADALISDGPR